MHKPQVPDLAALNPYHDGNLAAILVMSFTVVSGLVAATQQPEAARTAQAVIAPDWLPEAAA